MSIIENEKFQLSIFKAIGVCVLWTMLPAVFVFLAVIVVGLVNGSSDTTFTLLINFFENNIVNIVLSYINIIAVAFIVTRKKWSRLNLKLWNSNNMNWAIGTVVFAMGLNIIVSEMDNILRTFVPMSAEWAEKFQNLHSLPIGIFILQVVITAPIVEELLMRGIVARGLDNKYSRKKAIVITAILFGAIHMNIWQFTTAFVGGLFMTWLYLETDALLLSILAHAVHNGISIVYCDLLGWEVPGYNLEGIGFLSRQPLWFDAIGLVLMAIGIWFFIKARKERDNIIDKPDGRSFIIS